MEKECEQIVDIIKAGITAAVPANIINNAATYEDNTLNINGESYNLDHYKNLYIAGSGKGAIEMARALAGILKGRIKDVFIVSSYSSNLEDFEVIVSNHPVPDKRSLDAACRLIAFLSHADKDDFIIYLLSGGSSALIEAPKEGLTLDDIIKTTNIMLSEGLNIWQINELRKRMSAIKGGKLNRYIKCNGIVLVLSDVIGDKLTTIGSAPLYYETSSIKTRNIIEEYKLKTKLDKHIIKILSEDEPIVENKLRHYIVGNNQIALRAASKKATLLGYDAEIITDTIRGNAAEVAKVIYAIGEYRSKFINRMQALIFGGETTVVVNGDGTGGRNQELVLSALIEMREDINIIIAAAGTDGIDGPTDAAGAIASKYIYNAAIRQNLNMDKYLHNNDSYNFFNKVNAHIKLGHTGTNVCDIIVMLILK
jgi:hydroxypyruvate reductase/glycerate 2-kinase